MKKIYIIIIVVGIILLGGIPIVMASNTETKTINGNEKMVDDSEEGDRDRSLLSREEREKRAQEEKEQLINTIPTDEEIAQALLKKGNYDDSLIDAALKQAEEENKKSKELLSKAIEIINKYCPGKLKEPVDKIDRNLIEMMVNIINDNNLNENEEYILKQCIADKYLIILESDVLYDEINRIFKMN